MSQLAVAVSTITLVLVTDIEGILGLGPAIFLVAAAGAAFPAGRLMDRVGRVPVLAGGFATGILGCSTAALGSSTASTPIVIAGLALIGAAAGTVQLTRTAAADIYPQERRARGISYVLVGALAGAAIGPLVFRPLVAGRALELDALVLPYLAAAGICALGLVVALSIRPDPRKAALALAAHERPDDSGHAAPLRRILRRPGVPAAFVAAVASYSVMVSVMNLSGYVVVGHHHAQADVFTVISAHIAGMYALVLGVGELIDRLGRKLALAGGLLLMALSNLGMVWFSSVSWLAVSLFGLGLGWNLSYVAAAADMADRTAPVERGRLSGFTDLCASLLGAAFALLGGVTYSGLGVEALAVASTVVVVVPALWIAFLRRAPEPLLAEA